MGHFIFHIRLVMRAAIRSKTLFLIDLVGLMVGFTAFLVLYIYTSYEFSFDNYHEKHDRIFRVHRHATMDTPLTAHPYAEALENDFPEVEKTVRFHFREIMWLDKEQNRRSEEIAFVDPSMLHVFSWKLIQGENKVPLSGPNEMILTKNAAKKMLGNHQDQWLGSTLNMEIGSYAVSIKVVGILENLPANSHFTRDVYISYATLKTILNERYKNWFFNSTYTYVLLNHASSEESVESRFPQFLEKYLGEGYQNQNENLTNINDQYRLWLYPLRDIHLKSHLGYEIETGSTHLSITLLRIVAFLILAVALINHVHLNLAILATKGREIALHKFLGISKLELALKIGMELFLKCLLALLLVWPFLNFLVLISPQLLGFLSELEIFRETLLPISIILLTSILAGLYPLLKVRSVDMQLLIRASKSGIKLKGKKYLIAAQFLVSVVLLSFLFIVKEQLDYMKKKDLGFEKENKMVLNVKDRSIFSQSETLKTDLLSYPFVKGVSSSSNSIGEARYSKMGFFNPQKNAAGSFEGCYVLRVDDDFLSTLGLELLAGENFDLTNESDLQNGFILNRKAASLFEWANPESAIGMPFSQITNYASGESRRGHVLGVVEDFHYQSLHTEIEPLILFYDPPAFGRIIIDLKEIDREAIDEILSVITEFSPKYERDYSFLSSDYSLNYEHEKRLQNLIVLFSLVGGFIAALGVFTMSLFTTTEHAREYSIRKVLGASTLVIASGLSWNFVKPVILACILGIPVAFFLGERWLQNFEYRIIIPAYIFIISASISLGVAILCTIYQSIRLALMNPTRFLSND